MTIVATSNIGSFRVLPNELGHAVFEYLDTKSLLSLTQTCLAMYTFRKDDLFWKLLWNDACIKLKGRSKQNLKVLPRDKYVRYAYQLHLSKQLLNDCKQHKQHEQNAPDVHRIYLNLAVAVNAPHSVIRGFFQAKVLPDRATMLIAISCRKNLSIMQDIHDHCPNSHNNFEFQLCTGELRTASVIKNPKVYALQACHGLTDYPNFELEFVCHIVQSVRQQKNWVKAFQQQLDERYDYLKKLKVAPSKQSLDAAIKKMVIGSYSTCSSYTQSTEFPQFKGNEHRYQEYANEYQLRCRCLEWELTKYQVIEPILNIAKELLTPSVKKMDVDSEPTTAPMETD